MNGPIKNALLTLIMVTMLAVTAHASTSLPKNHTFARCNTCHATDQVKDAASNNVCLTCHKAGSTAWTNKQFYIGDMANPFGTTIEVKEKDTYTHNSHEWSATDDNPAAGALPPINPQMVLVNTYVGKLSCNRCHYLHYPVPDTAMLRVSNTNDEMCLDCHRLRDTRGHISGTHPVNVDYQASIAKSPGEFAASPVNSNPNNPTSALPLLSGKVMCSTCHGVHFTDSNSSTLDNFSTANNNGLKHSKGYLLRTDYRYTNYTSADSPNICNNCHMDKHSHNGKGQKIRCTDCHSGHVDFDPNALDAKSMVPNIFMVKRYMNWSSATGWKDNLAIKKQTFFRYTTGNKFLYKRADGKGVCESCHAVPPAGGKYPVDHNLVEAESTQCNGCHTHQGKSSYSPDCTVCHAQPPVSIATSAPKYFETTGKDEALSGHAVHTAGTGFGCIECHYSGAPAGTHNNGNFQDLFVPGYERLADNHGLTPVYNPTGTCSNVYCHSNGAPANSTLVVKDSPNWLTKNTQGCNLCHESTPTTNAHTAHIGKGYTCENCHAATVAGAAIKDKTKHANDQKEILFSSVGLNNVTISGTSCASVYCHSNGKGAYSTPVWTNPASGNCGTCHPTTGNATGAHQAHLSTGVAYGPQLNQFEVANACNNCHGPDYTANHINGTSELTNQATCTDSCHKNGLGSAQWTTGRTGITCESCHTGNLSIINNATAPDKGLNATEGHGKYYTACTTCHDQNAAHINPAVHDTRLLPAYVSLTDVTKDCTACHNSTVTNPARSNLYTHVTDIVGMKPVSNTKPSSCSICHDLHGTGNRGMIRTEIVVNNVKHSITYKNTTSMVSNVMSGGLYTGLCQICHTKTDHYKNSVEETSHYVGKRCTECHQHKSAATVYAFQPAGGCDACHGYPPAESVVGLAVHDSYTGAKPQNYVGGGGAHTIAGHIPVNASPKDEFVNCVNCHYGSDTNGEHTNGVVTDPSTINVKVNPKYKFDSKREIVYSGNKANDTTYFSGTCSNVSCHFQKSPKWSSEK